MAKAKKPTRSKLVKKLDVVFSQYIRLSNADYRGICTCVTCGREYHWKKIQAGHFISRAKYSTRWVLDNVKPQCYGCNCMQQGRQYEFSLYLGNNLAEELLEESRKIRKFTSVELEEMILHYSSLVKKLS